jgi:hypothetical protein
MNPMKSNSVPCKIFAMSTAAIFNHRARKTLANLDVVTGAHAEVAIPKRPYFQKICDSSWFRYLGILMSLGVIIQFGVAADKDLADNETTADYTFLVLFTVYFAFDVSVRFLQYLHPRYFFLDHEKRKWNIFDLVLLLVRIVRVFILPYATESTTGFGPKHIFQMIEMLRILRVLYAFPEVALMVDALAMAGRSAIPIICLLVTSMYCGGVMCDLWVKKSDQMQNFDYNNQTDFLVYQFGDVGWAMLSQLQLATFEAAVTLEAAYETSVPFCVFLLFCIAINAFMMLNTLIGFIFDLVAETRERGTEIERQTMIDKCFRLIDKDFSNDISQEEYEQNAQPVLRKYGVNEDVVTKAFSIIDSNGNNIIDKNEFSTYLLKMLRPPNNEELIKLSNELTIIEKKLGEIRDIKNSGKVTHEQARSLIHHQTHHSSASRLRRGVFLQSVRRGGVVADSSNTN